MDLPEPDGPATTIDSPRSIPRSIPSRTTLYGGGFKRGDTKFAEFLNGVLEKYKSDGRWQRAYDKWLGQYTKEEQKPPDATLDQALQGEVT